MGDFKEDSLYPQYAICKKHKIQKWKKNTAELNVWLTRLKIKGVVFSSHMPKLLSLQQQSSLETKQISILFENV